MKNVCIALLLFFCLSSAFTISAQDAVTVPDLAGLNGPQAGAALNRAGLRLGTQNALGWTDASGVAPDTISTQSLAAGSTAAPGTAVDVTILRTLNLALVYDDNDLTAINLTDSAINLGGLSFSAKEGTTASFAATRWIGTFQPYGCGQVWPINRSGAKEVAGCDVSTTTWISTNKSDAHFWTATNGDFDHLLRHAHADLYDWDQCQHCGFDRAGGPHRGLCTGPHAG